MPIASINGIEISYEVTGDGDPVLLIMGMGGPGAAWHMFTVPALVGAGFRAITYDNRGVPPSSVPPPPYTIDEMVADAAALIEHLDIAPCQVVGTSLGAIITQELALARPELVRAAVMMGTIGRKDLFRTAYAAAQKELAESGVKLPPRYAAVSAMMLLYGPETLSNEAAIAPLMALLENAPLAPPVGLRGQSDAAAAYDDRLGQLGGIKVPSLVIGFEADLVTPASLCREVAGAIPECEYVEIAGAGHAGPYEKSLEVNRVLIDFLSRT